MIEIVAILVLMDKGLREITVTIVDYQNRIVAILVLMDKGLRAENKVPAGVELGISRNPCFNG